MVNFIGQLPLFHLLTLSSVVASQSILGVFHPRLVLFYPIGLHLLGEVGALLDQGALGRQVGGIAAPRILHPRELFEDLLGADLDLLDPVLWSGIANEWMLRHHSEGTRLRNLVLLVVRRHTLSPCLCQLVR